MLSVCHLLQIRILPISFLILRSSDLSMNYCLELHWQGVIQDHLMQTKRRVFIPQLPYTSHHNFVIYNIVLVKNCRVDINSIILFNPVSNNLLSAIP